MRQKRAMPPYALLAIFLLPANSFASDQPAPRVKVRVGGVWSAERKLTYDEIDHTAFDRLLRRFVNRHGMVGYRDWKADPKALAELHDYLCCLGLVDTRAHAGCEAKLAFWINAYNALTIWGILRDYPVASIQELNRKGSSYQIFDDLELCIDGRYYSLNQIEHQVLRPMKEPRVHFALVCAAKGCPRLRNEAYTAGRLWLQLTDNTFDFFARPDRFRVHPARGEVKMSPILKWYRSDFGPNDLAALAFAFPYLPPPDQERLRAMERVHISHLGYNWALNDQCPGLRQSVTGIGYGVYGRLSPVLDGFRRSGDRAQQR